MTAPHSPSFTVLSSLPGDAWSEAHLAQAPGTEGKLCLRLLKSEASADAARVERFLEGARQLTALRHSAVVSIHCAGTTRDGRPYVLTDLIEGAGLASKGPLPLEDL